MPIAAASMRKKGKQISLPPIAISSSSEEEDEEESEEEEEEEEEDDDDDDDSDDEDYDGEDDDPDDDDVEEEEDSGGDDDEDDDDNDNEGEEESRDRKLLDEEVYDKIVDLLRRRKSLDHLKLEECKVYLRKHRLRLGGAKGICIERILEHWRIKDGNGEKLYPKSSFSMNCTGDVCKGDIILFKQRVYRKFGLARRGADIIGKRVVAGRVVKESYGADKQQHTFTVEVLWSKGVKPLPPLFPLLVKGRNLYRLKTFRQCWQNEAERLEVLAEKHKRGAAARQVRAIAKARTALRGSKRARKSFDKDLPPKKHRKKEREVSSGEQKLNACGGKAQYDGRRKANQVAAKGRHLSLSGQHTKQANYQNTTHIQQQFYQRNPIYIDHRRSTTWQLNQDNNMAPSHTSTWNIHGLMGNVGIPSNASGEFHRTISRANYVSHPYGDPMYYSGQPISGPVLMTPDFVRGPFMSPPRSQFHRRR
ncbi:Zinc finger CCCH domain-containing protein 62 [Ananas comosus]|uniref:Zinc finger CCCH domain-containing protein 62 n=1 Tax=Ananas comosus TaxID=4615 RepID=A0A199V1C5_ANACO|nr:Zinc finger CCCH domain-containing protein 62 [Ananas comosus]